MGKILISNNDYQEVLKNEASLFWSKVFKKADEGIKGDRLEELKNSYWKEMKENLSVYEIEKFDPQLKNENLNKFIENYCTNNTITDDYTRYTGHTPKDYIFIEGCKEKFSSSYNQYLTCNEDLTIVEICEGDITVLTYNNITAYKNQLAKARKFYENY